MNQKNQLPFIKLLQLTLVFFAVLLFKNSIAQNTSALLEQYQAKAYDDTSKLTLSFKIAKIYANKNPDTCLLFSLQALHLARAASNTIAEESALIKLAGLYQEKENYKKAIDYGLLALQLNQQSKNSKNTIIIYNLLGDAYNNSRNNSQALMYFKKFYLLAKQQHDTISIVIALNNLSASLMPDSLNQSETLIKEAINLDAKRNRFKNYPTYYSNLSYIYGLRENVFKEEEYMYKALFYAKKLNNSKELITTYSQLADFYSKQQNNTKALQHIDSTLQVASKSKDVDDILTAYNYSSEIFSMAGDYEKAYEYHVKYTHLKDSLYSTDNESRINSLASGYEIEQKEFEITAKANAQAQKQQLITASVIIVLIVVAVFTFLLYRRFKVTTAQKEIIELKEKETQHQNKIITQQKALVDGKQKEILDSINYAKRIQYTLLAHADFLSQYLPKHLVYFNPKDIVSGDFYWATKQANYFFLAVCDSTGHGVPGAFMSLMNIGFLTEAISEKNILNPGDIFNYVRMRLINSVSKENQKDGFDGVLLRFEIEDNAILSVAYAAANIAPLLIRDNKLIELSKDKMPVGIGEKEDGFNTHTIDLKKEDALYVFTDGFPDQFGGPKGRKFMSKNLRELLLANAHLPIQQQKELLETTFKNWVGNTEQIDDVTLIGIRV